MYHPSSTSSSSQSSMVPNGRTNTTNNSSGLIRYGSAPSSLLTTAVDSVINPTHEFSSLGSNHIHTGPTPSRFFPSSEPSSKTSNNNSHVLQRAYGLKKLEGTIGSGGGAGMVSSCASSSATASPLIRQSSSPAGFLNRIAHACTSSEDNGLSVARGHGISRLNSQMNFTRQEILSQISEENENVDNGLNAENDKRKSTHSYTTASYGVGSWEDVNTIVFSMGSSNRSENVETQLQFSMPQTMLEMGSTDTLLNIPEDSVPCKIRAKRGCATHPRSIAERERRTRISGKLKTLQDLVPNMDKQTSYADMLDLAVQHIKGLQNQVQKLNKELENCTCGCGIPQNGCRDENS